MKRKRFTEEQIIGILKEHEGGVPVADFCRKHGVSDGSMYKWKARFGPAGQIQRQGRTQNWMKPRGQGQRELGLGSN